MYSNRTHANRPSALTAADRAKVARAAKPAPSYTVHAFARHALTLAALALVYGVIV